MLCSSMNCHSQLCVLSLLSPLFFSHSLVMIISYSFSFLVLLSLPPSLFFSTTTAKAFQFLNSIYDFDESFAPIEHQQSSACLLRPRLRQENSVLCTSSIKAMTQFSVLMGLWLFEGIIFQPINSNSRRKWSKPRFCFFHSINLNCPLSFYKLSFFFDIVSGSFVL